MWRNLFTWQMVRWSNSPHDRLSCGKNSPHGKCEENMWKMWRNNVVFCRILCYFVAESFYCDLRCFIAKYVSSRFTRFCVGKFFVKKIARGEKMTNMRYGRTVFPFQTKFHWLQSPNLGCRRKQSKIIIETANIVLFRLTISSSLHYNM